VAEALVALEVSPLEEQEDEVGVVVPIQTNLVEVEEVGTSMVEGVAAVALVDQAFLVLEA